MRAPAILPAVILLLVGAACRNEQPSEGPGEVARGPAKPAGIAARLEGTEITDAQVDVAYQRLMAERNTASPADAAQVASDRRSLAEGLAIEAALYAKAQKLATLPAQAEIDAQVSKVRASFPSSEDFMNYLAKRNMSEVEFADSITRNLAVEKLIQQEVHAKQPPSEQEIQQFFEKNKAGFYRQDTWRVSEIVIPIAGGEEATLAQVRKLQDRIEDGEDFGKLAGAISTGASKTRGGDKGYLRRGGPQFLGDEQIFALQAGQCTPPIKYQDGYRIFKCTERLEPKQLGLDDPKVREECIKQIGQSRVNDYILSVKLEAKVQVF
ncbi:MAG: peptidyl-prolyl cis-trans isomerase [Acidobacteria bacterium]|nr:peptidyl-prolyl cis-trans isomerase [Acidobacteriota bacterium]